MGIYIEKIKYANFTWLLNIIKESIMNRKLKRT